MPARERCRAAIDLKRWDIAQREITAALGEAPNDAALHAWMAEALYRQDKFDEAREHARNAIRLAPDWYVGYFWLGWSYVTEWPRPAGYVGAAEQVATDSRRVAPDKADVYALSAVVERVQQKHLRSIEWADEGLALDPDHWDCLKFKALGTEAIGNYRDSLPHFRRLLEMEPENGWVHLQLARVLHTLGRYETAFTHVLSARELDPNNDEVHPLFQKLMVHHHPLLKRLNWLSRVSGWQHEQLRGLLVFALIGSLFLVAITVSYVRDVGLARAINEDTHLAVLFAIIGIWVQLGAVATFLLHYLPIWFPRRFQMVRGKPP